MKNKIYHVLLALSVSACLFGASKPNYTHFVLTQTGTSGDCVVSADIWLIDTLTHQEIWLGQMYFGDEPKQIAHGELTITITK